MGLCTAPYKMLVIKTLEDEWYVVIKAYKLTVFEILRYFLYCLILRVHAIPTLESTDSMICIGQDLKKTTGHQFAK